MHTSIGQGKAAAAQGSGNINRQGPHHTDVSHVTASAHDEGLRLAERSSVGNSCM